MEAKQCQWCGHEFKSGDGDWGRPKTGRYSHRPGRFCSQPCQYRHWQLEAGRLSPEQSALRRLQIKHRAEFARLLAEEVASRSAD